MRSPRQTTPNQRLAMLGLVFLALCAACATGPSPGSPSASAARPCEGGTLGIEAAAAAAARRRYAGPGAPVAEVLPGGPADAGGVRPGDLVLEIGGARLDNDCDLEREAFGRSCAPLRVVLRRGAQTLDLTLTPVEQVAYLERSCRDGVQTGCAQLARLLRNRNREGDRDRALSLDDGACRAGSARACADEGIELVKRPGRESDAVAALERSCGLGSGAGCAHLGFLFATGTIQKRDDRKATPLYVKACELGDALGCYNAGLMADEGRGTPRDGQIALARYTEACEMGSSTACTNLGFQYEHGRSVPKDPARAFALYKKGCAGTGCQRSNLSGCLNVGRAYRDGIGVNPDKARAAAVFDEACRRPADPDDTDYAEAGSRACSLLGALALEGDGVPKDPQKGRELSELGCDRGDPFGCFNAATIYGNGTGVPVDRAAAARFFDRACQKGDGEGCHELATAYDKGSGVARDRKKAAELFRKACQLGFQKSCGRQVR